MATIKQVAQLAGVGVGTASRVINGKGSYSPDAAQRVEAAAQALGFRPSTIARALSLRSSGTIGVFVPDFKGPFYGPLLDAIDTELRGHDRHMVAVNGCSRPLEPRGQALESVGFLIDRECDGVVVISNALRDEDFAALHRRCPRLAIVNRHVAGLEDRCFAVDHRAAGALAAAAVIGGGHRRLAIVAGPAEAGDNVDRIAGFVAEAARRGLDAGAIPIEPGDFEAASGWHAMQRLLARTPRPSAVFCANDLMAMGALSRLHHAGVDVPGEMSVVGYDDMGIAAYMSPPLTTVRIPIGAMALEACRLLMNECYGTDYEASRSFEPALVERASLQPAMSGA